MSESSNNFDYKKVYSLNYYRLNKDKIADQKIYYQNSKKYMLEQAKNQIL